MTKKFDQWRKRKQEKRPVTKAQAEVTDGSNVEPGIKVGGSANASVYKYLAGFVALVMTGVAGYRFTRPVELQVTVCKSDDVRPHIKTVFDATLGTLGPDMNRTKAEKGDGKKQKPKPQPDKGKEKVNDKKPKAKDKKKQGILAGLAGVSGLLWIWRNRLPTPDPDKPPRDPSNGFELIKRFLQWYLAETQVKWELWRPAEFVRGCVRRGTCKIQRLPIAPVQCYIINNVLEKAVKVSKYAWVLPLIGCGVSIYTAPKSDNGVLPSRSDHVSSHVRDITSKSEDGQGPVRFDFDPSNFSKNVEVVSIDKTDSTKENTAKSEARTLMSTQTILYELLAQGILHHKSLSFWNNAFPSLNGKLLGYCKQDVSKLLASIKQQSDALVLQGKTTGTIVIKLAEETIYIISSQFYCNTLTPEQDLLNLQSIINNPDSKLGSNLTWIGGPPQSKATTKEHKSNPSSASTRAPTDNSPRSSIASLTAERDAARSELVTTKTALKDAHAKVATVTAERDATKSELAAEKDNAAKQIAQLTAENLKLHEEEAKLHDKITILENKLKAAESAASKCTCGRSRQ